MINVPDLKGMGLQQADGLLKSLGLGWSYTGDVRERSTVGSQTPAAGQQVELGTTINLHVVTTLEPPDFGTVHGPGEPGIQRDTATTLQGLDPTHYGDPDNPMQDF